MSSSPARLRVEFVPSRGRTVWSFKNTYGPVVGLGARIENFRGVDAQGREVEVRKLAPGEFTTNQISHRVSYEVSLEAPARSADLAHVSWLNGERGLLMLADLVPATGTKGETHSEIQLKLPDGWLVASSAPLQAGVYLVEDLDKAVFLVSPSIKHKRMQADGIQLAVVTTGSWPFHEKEVAKIAAKMVREYFRLTGYKLRGTSTLLLLPYFSGSYSWSAETRGDTIVLLLDQRGERRQMLARLGVILTHEVFHLWVPNALRLSGDYDWFFEGFTVYQALRTAKKVGLIDFAEYLRTLARAYESYRGSLENNHISLIEMSRRRWSSPRSIYSKGMLVAFLYHLQILAASNAKTTGEAIYRDLFQGRFSEDRDGNEVIISLLNSGPGMEAFSNRFVAGADDLNMKMLLEPFGIEVQQTSQETRFLVAPSLDASQRKVLRTLGYRD